MDIVQYWNAVLKQNAEKIKSFFHLDAYVRWHNTNEHFTVNEFIKANCEYPGQWDGKIEKVYYIEKLIITVVHVFDSQYTVSFHVVSFIQLKDEKIISIDEYWGDDGLAPQWRLDKHIGKPICELENNSDVNFRFNH